MLQLPPTITQVLEERFHNQANDKAFTFMDSEVEETITYQQLFERSYSVARTLREHGAAGERVIIAYNSSLEYIYSFFGCLMAGAIAVPVYPPRTSKKDARFDSILDDSGAAIVVTSPNVLNSLKLRNSEYLKQDTVWLTPTVDEDVQQLDSFDIHPCEPDTLAFLQYTSGSTSSPKGVMVTHDNIMTNIRMMRNTYRFPAEGVFVSWLPLFHDMGLIGMMLSSACNGFHCVLLSPVTFLQSPITWLNAISKHKGNITAAPNFAYDLCARKIKEEQIDALDLSAFTHALCGAEPIKMSTARNFINRFARAGFRSEAFCPSYGLAEATLMVSGAQSDQAPKSLIVHKKPLLQNRIVIASDDFLAGPNVNELTELVNCGPISDELNLQIVDPDSGIVCPPDRIGEIWMAGAAVAQGYWNRPEATESTFRARIAGEEGVSFLRTGDLGFKQSGELFIAGRLKDIIMIRGENHYPNDIEWSVVHSHPNLNKDACGAFSVLDEQQDEQLVVVVEIEKQFRKEDLLPVVKAVRAIIAEEHSLQLYGLIICNPGGVPKTTSGKIQRKQCKSLFLDQTLPALLAVIRNRVVEDWVQPSATPEREKVNP
ncbi:acyl-CoA synthetase [Paenibacillus sp. CCS19]|uniref:fatty acyl-AMP ligase n=1 Tax=Paenibacillus sp. CCS19 TaxID=3158387 RepID=UPI002568E685|nr:fatty acyl-AMP ligase [Paenibacillus cellulosilyticus]GMK39953.1 acyl-CoA synthetase [Paenibacillus cellulosilyticus]